MACAGHGRRIEKAAKHVKDNLYEQELNSPWLAQLRHQQSRERAGFDTSLKALSALLLASGSAAAWQAPHLGLLTSSCLPATRRSLRVGSVKLLLYDLDVLVKCAQAGSWDNVKSCVAAAEPWLGINEQGQITITAQAAGGGLAGSIGVLGTLAAFKMRQGEIKDRLKCIYCEGSGRITCGRCLSKGIFTDKDGVQSECANCASMGSVVCINCQGSGRSIPEDILRRLGDEEQGISDGDLIGLFDQLPAGGRNKAEGTASGNADKAD